VFRPLKKKLAITDLKERIRSGEHLLLLRSRLDKKILAWGDWGIISPREALDLKSAVPLSVADLWFAHFAVHLFISALLRFPWGSVVRFLWTFMALALSWRKHAENPQGYARAKRTHTVLVLFVTLVPGVGAAAYVCTREAWRFGPLLPVVLFDLVSFGLPSRAYVFCWHLARRYIPYARYVLP